MLARLKFDIHALVNEILDQIPQDLIINGRVLDPAIGGGQFVAEIERRKRAAGKTDSEIRDSVFGFEDNILRLNYAVNKHGLVGTYLAQSFLQESFGSMKFDVIIGNPPYQDTSGQNTLYPKFYAKSSQFLVDGGYLAMIMPPAIIPGLWGLKDPDGIRMPDPLAIKTIAIGNHIKNQFDKRIASDFCWFIVENSSSDNSAVSIQTDAGVITASGPIFPKVVSAADLQIAQTILNKCFSFYKDPYGSSTSDHGKKAKADPRGKHKAVESISTSGELKTRNIKWIGDHPHFGRPKVMLPMYGKTAVVDYSHELVSASQEKTKEGKLTGHNIVTVLTNDDVESENLISMLESRLQRFFNSVTGETRSPYVNFLKNFRGVPLTRRYSDDELEIELGLTSGERKWLSENY